MSESHPTLAQQLAIGLWWVLVISVPAAWLLALWARRRYVRAVVRLQRGIAGPVAAAARAAVAVPADGIGTRYPAITLAPSLTIQVRDAATIGHHASTGYARKLRRKVLRAQFLAGLFFWWALLAFIFQAMLLSAAGVETASDGKNDWLGVLGWVVLFAPPMLAWLVQGGISNRLAWMAAAVVGLVITVAFAIASESWMAAAGGAALVAILALIGAALLSPSARGAGPPLLSAIVRALVTIAALALLAAWLFPDSPDGSQTTSQLIVQIVLLVVILLAATAASWWVLLRIARRYEARRCSELQLALDTYWNLIALSTLAIILSVSFNEGVGDRVLPVAVSALLCWMGYRLVLRLWLWRISRRAAQPLGPLLLLRVFKGSAVSESFMERFLAYWRFTAPVWMIGGPDLAGAQMEPSEFFAFIRRGLDGLFVRSAEEIPSRVARLDRVRDPDSRLRVDELFCADTTWQPTVLALLQHAAVVVLDLREYNADHAGTRYEIVHTMNLVPVEKAIVLVGAADDLPRVETELRAAWNSMSADSPNRCAPTAVLNVLRLKANRAAEIRGLYSAAAALAAKL